MFFVFVLDFVAWELRKYGVPKTIVDLTQIWEHFWLFSALNICKNWLGIVRYFIVEWRNHMYFFFNSMFSCIIIKFAVIRSKDLPNMNTFCDWLSETKVISVYDSFFRNYISILLLSFIVLSSHRSACSYRYVATRYTRICCRNF